MKKILLLVCAVGVCVSCGGQKSKKRADSGAGTTTALSAAGSAGADSVKIYRPAFPGVIVDPEERGRWAVEHWWDGFNFADTLGVGRWREYAEQAFVDFDDQLLSKAPYDIGGEAIAVLFQKAAENRDVFRQFAEIAEKYLFDPNSPFRDDESYISVLNAVLANPALDEWERIRPQEQLRLALKNRVGNPAADFRYTLETGATGTLYGLKAPYTLIFFNNPGCSACRETMGQITGSPYLGGLIQAGTLQMLAVYSDEDIAAWRDYAPNMPEGWINSYDATQKIKNDELYDLKAIPTLYLLARDKRVMLKDVMSIPLIEQTIYNNEQAGTPAAN